jgi:cytidine deaminase
MTEKKLIELAKRARKKAYAPLTKYKVGAALETKDGKVFTGCNVESPSFGALCCAERTALFKAISEGARRFKRIAVVTDASPPSPPCGFCRQTLHDLCPGIEVIMANTQGDIKIINLSDLLPLAYKMP